MTSRTLLLNLNLVLFGKVLFFFLIIELFFFQRSCISSSVLCPRSDIWISLQQRMWRRRIQGTGANWELRVIFIVLLGSNIRMEADVAGSVSAAEKKNICTMKPRVNLVIEVGGLTLIKQVTLGCSTSTMYERYIVPFINLFIWLLIIILVVVYCMCIVLM